jgi:hypothetical protein
MPAMTGLQKPARPKWHLLSRQRIVTAACLTATALVGCGGETAHHSAPSAQAAPKPTGYFPAAGERTVYPTAVRNRFLAECRRVLLAAKETNLEALAGCGAGIRHLESSVPLRLYEANGPDQAVRSLQEHHLLNGREPPS